MDYKKAVKVATKLRDLSINYTSKVEKPLIDVLPLLVDEKHIKGITRGEAVDRLVTAAVYASFAWHAVTNAHLSGKASRDDVLVAGKMFVKLLSFINTEVKRYTSDFYWCAESANTTKELVECIIRVVDARGNKKYMKTIGERLGEMRGCFDTFDGNVHAQTKNTLKLLGALLEEPAPISAYHRYSGRIYRSLYARFFVGSRMSCLEACILERALNILLLISKKAMYFEDAAFYRRVLGRYMRKAKRRCNIK